MRYPPDSLGNFAWWPRGAGAASPAEGPGVLAAGVDQTGVGGGLDVAFGMERRGEFDAVVDEPVMMVDRIGAVPMHLGGVDPGTAGGEQERLHVGDGVVEPTGALGGRPAAQIEQSTRHR